MKRLLALTAIPLFLLSCQAKPFLKKEAPLRDSEGAAYVYLAPLSQEAQRLAFRIAGLFAERADGRRIPLPLVFAEIDPKEVGRERLLAYGALPVGQYAGLSLVVENATMKGEEGMATLRLAEEATGIPVPFVVEGKRAVVLKLQFRYRDSVQEGFRFSPAFFASIPGVGELPAGRFGLAASRGANTVTVFDKTTGQVVSVIPTGESPVGMALDALRNRVYVAVYGDDAVEVIDLLEARVLDRLNLAGGDVPLDLALTPDGRTLLSVNSGSNTVSIIDPSAMIETDRIPVGSGPHSLILTATGRRGYVFNALSNTISVLDVPRALVTATISTEAGPAWGQLNRDESRLYVLQQGSPYLGVIDTSSLSVTKRIYVGIGATALKVDPRTDWIYLARNQSIDVDIYDPFSLLPMDIVRTGGEAAHLAIDGEEGNLWIVLPGRDRVLAVSLTGKRRAAEIDVGTDPRRVTLMGKR